MNGFINRCVGVEWMSAYMDCGWEHEHYRGVWCMGEGCIHDMRMDVRINILLVKVNIVDRCMIIDQYIHIRCAKTCTVDVHVDDKRVKDVSMRACMCVCIHEQYMDMWSMYGR